MPLEWNSVQKTELCKISIINDATEVLNDIKGARATDRTVDEEREESTNF